MEPVKAALKKREMVLLKPFSLQSSYNDLSSDDFFVDELLDFTDKEELCENYEEEDAKPLPREGTTTNGAVIKPSFDFCSSLSEIDVQMDELESLEWLSEFVDGSNAEYAILKEEENAIGRSVFKLPVPARARSKRSRARARVSPESSSSSGSSCLSYTSPKHGVWAGKPSNEKERRCLHCGVQRTPQWRAGPLGAKTLCNACGVRYKSGRLLPEYRPACSPTFCSELHSNSHRKVLEMRRRNLGIGHTTSERVSDIL